MATHSPCYTAVRRAAHYAPMAALSAERSPLDLNTMPCHLVALSVDANDPLRLARFWAGVLDWELADEPDGGVVLLPSDDTGFRIEFFPTQAQKVGRNRMH